MLINHIKFAFRLLQKDSAYSILNILGLALGITVGIILLIYLQSEFSYDLHHEKHRQIYRFTNHLKADGSELNTARSARELGPILKEELPEVLNYVRFREYSTTMVESIFTDNTKRQFYEDFVFETDSSIFSIFTHEIYEGDAKSCLDGNNKVVITKSIAEKYFGHEPALGKILTLPDNDLREVTAVISDLPENSHFKYEILLSEIKTREWVTNGDSSSYSEGFWEAKDYTYLLLPENYDPAVFYKKFDDIIFEKTFGIFGQQIAGSVIPKIQPLADIHFNTDLSNDEPAGNINYVYTFAGVGLFIILLACINYTNMATARSMARTGEMGIRKVLGFSKMALFRNVMIEAMLIAFVAMLIAIFLVYMVLEATPFNSLIGKQLSLNFFSNPILLAGTLGITVLIGVVSGAYPAIYIPSVPVVAALKGTIRVDKSGTTLRKALIVFQFVISLLVIICTVLMNQQIDFMTTKELGFTKENVLLVEVRDTATEDRMDVIKTELLKNPNVLGAATSWGTPGLNIGSELVMVERDSTVEQQMVNIIYGGPDVIETLGIRLTNGRGFRKESDADYYYKFLVNETGARELGWSDAMGKKVRYFHDETDGEVIGVVKDFNFQSLHTKILPLLINMVREQGGRLHVKLTGNDLPATIDYVKQVITRFDPNHPFEYTFLDQEFGRQYRADQTQQQLISYLSYICIFVSLLGLIGLSAFTASRKAKEISIRKVLGASVPGIVLMFSKDYVKLIVIAFIIAVPLADYMTVEWMSKFAYQTPIRWYYFLLPGALVLVLGLLTVGLQSLKSAKANPVEGLRRE